MRAVFPKMPLTSGHGSRGKASSIPILKAYICRQYSRGNCPCLDVYQELWPETLITPLNAERKEWSLQELIDRWKHHLQEHDRSGGTIKKYGQAVVRFMNWFECEEQAPLQLSALTPIALIGYRNYLQHEQRKSVSTINLHVSALRTWCGWLTEQGYLAADPAAHIKLVGGEASSSRKGLKSAQVNALLRQAQLSRDPTCNYAIV